MRAASKALGWKSGPIAYCRVSAAACRRLEVDNNQKKALYAWCFTVLFYRFKINIYCFIALCVHAPQCGWANQMFFVFSFQHSSRGPFPLSRPAASFLYNHDDRCIRRTPRWRRWVLIFQCAAVLFLSLRDYVSCAGPGVFCRPLADFHFQVKRSSQTDLHLIDPFFSM